MNEPPPFDDLEDEIRDHIERETADYVERGMTPEAARTAALRAFGNPTLVREDVRAVWIRRWFDQLVQDARYARRSLRRHAGVSLVTVVTLAAAIGLTTAIFSVVNAVLLRPLSYPHPERVVWLATQEAGSGEEHVAAHDFLAWQAAPSLERLVAFDLFDERVSVGRTVATVRVALVSQDFWALTEAQPALGRLPLSDDEEAVVVSGAFFEHTLGADPGVVGATMALDGMPAHIVGVLPLSFRVDLPAPPTWAALVPRPVDAYRVFKVAPPENGRVQLVRAIGLLRPDATLTSARAELETIRARVAAANADLPHEPVLRVQSLADVVLGPARASLGLLFGAVLLLLVVACVNIAGLQLARGSARASEMAVRAALGASRGRLLRQLLTEAALVTAAGAVGGLMLAEGLRQILVGLLPDTLPRVAEATIDGRVLLFAVTAASVAALVCGLGPAASSFPTAPARGLTQSPSSTARPRWTPRRWLVGLQIAVTVVLLCGAVLLARSYWRLQHMPSEVAPERTLVSTVTFYGPLAQSDERRRAVLDTGLQRLATLPGVEAVGLSDNGAGRMGLIMDGVTAVRPVDRQTALTSSVSTGYAAAIGMRLLAGRWFTDTEPQPVLVVNRALVRAYFAERDPLNQRIQIGGRPGAPDAEYATVIGVVDDFRYAQLDAAPVPELFVPLAAGVPFRATFVVRTAGQPWSIAGAVGSRLASLDSLAEVSDVTTLAHTLAASVAPRRLHLLLMGTFALAALLLSGIGVYGAIASSIAERRREFAVRLALGADPAAIFWRVVRSGMGMAIAGLVIGLAASLAAGPLIANQLYALTPTDPTTFAGVGAGLAAIAFGACVHPARRAARAQPVDVLRHE